MKQMFRWFCTLAGIAGCALAMVGAAHATTPITVKVGAYEYGVVYFFEDKNPTGFAFEMVSALNAIQSTYYFELVETSSRRRYSDLASGMFDMLLLESPDWGWRDQNVVYSNQIVTEHDLYVARRKDIPGAGWFNDVTKHTILGVLGFHYGFANFKADPDYLNAHFNMSLLYNEQQVLDKLLAGDGDVAVLSAGFLARGFQRRPELSNQIFMGPKQVSSSHLLSVMSYDSAISVADYNALINILHIQGNLAEIWRKLHGDLLG
ncbi:hypothetical protein [Thalassospira alkalitolerans]|uniref:hypothetical protein n=1 Tax=Thalassospira alkalitolerans TaxID=1293890 RepID=UPI003AA97509